MYTALQQRRYSRLIEIIVVCFILLILAAILFPVFAVARSGNGREHSTCVNHVKEQVLALQIYAQDYDNRLPRAAEWMDATLPYSWRTDIYQCSNLPKKATEHQEQNNPTVFGYAFNNEFSTHLISSIHTPEKALLTYDSSDLSWNANAYKRTGMARPPRHYDAGSNICGFVDGHAKGIKLIGVSADLKPKSP